MAGDTSNPSHAASMRNERALDRLVLFSDAVIAIVITLMVLEVKPPNVHGERELLAALLAQWPEYLAVGVSFLVIGIFWTRHHAHFQWVTRVDQGLIWLNLLSLLSICAIPFVTALLSHNAGRLGTIIYAATVATASLLMGLMWAYTNRTGMISPDAPPNERSFAVVAALATAAVFVASIAIAFWDADAAKFSWLAATLVSVARRTGKLRGARVSGP